MPSQIEFKSPRLTGFLTTPDQEWVCKPLSRPVHEERFSQASNQREPIEEVASPTMELVARSHHKDQIKSMMHHLDLNAIYSVYLLYAFLLGFVLLVLCGS